MRIPARHLSVLLTVGLLAAPALSRADVLCVTPGGGGGCFAAIGAALAVAQPGDTVRVATGTYVENVLLAQPVTLQGGWNSSFTTRDPASFVTTIRPATATQSVVTIQGPAAPVFEGFTVTGGQADLGFNHGGGLRVSDSNAVLRDNVVVGNRAYLLGGGIWIQRGAPRLVGNRVEGNRVTGDPPEIAKGGGIALEADEAVLVGNTIRGNGIEMTHGLGGGLFIAAGGPVTVRGGAIEDNTGGRCDESFVVESFGGGVFVDDPGIVTLESVRVARNCSGGGGGISIGLGGRVVLKDSNVTGNASPQGGGIYSRRGVLEMSGTSVTANLAAFAGGIAGVAGSTLQIVNSSISGNSSLGVAGGLLVFGSLASADLVNVTVANNLADADGAGTETGGGVFNYDNGVVTLSHTLLAGNRRGVAGVPDDCAGGDTLTLQGHNLVQTQTDCAFAGDFTGSRFGVDPQLGPLADNGGPAPTHALLATSPARDAGLPAACPATDQRGVPRPQGAACDIGAYEASDVPFLFLRLNESAFGPGDTMVLTAELIPGLVPVLADAYIVIRLPDGTLLSLVPAGAVAGIAPAATGFVPVLFRGEVVRYTFQGHEPGGTFDWFSVLTRTGTLDFLGAVDQDSFAFSP
jgi:hypothetical protein